MEHQQKGDRDEVPDLPRANAQLSVDFGTARSIYKHPIPEVGDSQELTSFDHNLEKHFGKQIKNLSAH